MHANRDGMRLTVVGPKQERLRNISKQSLGSGRPIPNLVKCLYMPLKKLRNCKKFQCSSLWSNHCHWSKTGLHESLQPGCEEMKREWGNEEETERKWRENEEMRRKWRESEEMERDWLSTFPHSLSISSLFLHFLILSPFPTSKCVTFCCKMLNTALLSRMSQKSQHTRYEEIILGRTCCEEAPQFVPAWSKIPWIGQGSISVPFDLVSGLWKRNHEPLKLCRKKNKKL